MNEKQIAFIICTSDDLYMEECIWHIHQLIIPEGYSIDILTIKDADSMAAGYQAAMNASPAVYKVYLHQDTFIVNRNFITDILRVFDADEKIGMIGVAGIDYLPEHGELFNHWNVGGLYGYYYNQMVDWSLGCTKEYREVYAIDGMIMVTKLDIPWREDLFRGWNYYDISQSFEMIRYGYKVVVPHQEQWWCIHDVWSNNMQNYYGNMARLMDEYQEYDWDANAKKYDDTDELYRISERMSEFIHGKFCKQYMNEIKTVVVNAYEKFKFNKTVLLAKEIMQLLEADPSFQDESMDWSGISEKYLCVRFLLMREMYDQDESASKVMENYLHQGIFSQEAVDYIRGRLKASRDQENEVRIKMIDKYQDSDDVEIKEIVDYLRTKREVDNFNSKFKDEYLGREYKVYEDSEKGMHYVLLHGKRMYLKKKQTMYDMMNYSYSVTMEQDIESPHRYLDDSFQVEQGDVVIDAGVAEGNFALDIIDRVKHIYLVEGDPEWLEALTYTFAPYQDKVTIVPKMLCDKASEETTTIDAIMAEKPVNFIKMDIEGSEEAALIGAEHTLQNSNHVKCAICSYHRSGAENRIKEVLHKTGMKTSTTKGYMFFREDAESYEKLELRRGIVRGYK
ncbi:MAG: glycosyltransferase [Lachnospira sp.]|nr:glycosyltransferase [Lachnospira sp.]